MSWKTLKTVFVTALLAIASIALASDDPREQRHELMEGVRDAAKVVGAMLRGEREYDAAAAMESLQVFKAGASEFGDMFPEGSQAGSEAAPSIWEDRAGFDQALQNWRDATDNAIAAAPATLEDAKPVLGPIFKTCKGCHDEYRIEDE
jgi:cytochrome c556